MKQITSGNIVIECEPYNRFNNLVRGYKVDEQGNPVAFLGKFIVSTNYTEEEIIKLF